MPSLNGWLWHFLENYIYYIPDPPPRKRTKPMQVICVGPPRSGTESLQHALLKLGYDYTYHGWDMLYEEPHRMPGWVRLARKKWFGGADGDCHISAEEFDALLGHAVAVTDAASSVFAAEMIEAYPNAKVILNTRKDLDKWHASAINTLVSVNENWMFYFLSWWVADFFWSWHVYERFMWHLLFRCPDSTLGSGIRNNGKWVYREHCNMIKGLVPKDRLLEWSVEDGWEPLCEFLGKQVPDEPFPRTNDAAGWKGREQEALKSWASRAFRNMGIAVALVVAGVSGIWRARS